MVAEQNDNGIVGVRTFFESFQYATDLMVHEGNASQVSLDALAKLFAVVLLQKSELGVLWELVDATANCGNVEKIVVADGR